MEMPDMATCPAFCLSMTIVHLLILSLAVWRISNMLADTDQSGPFEILDRIRSLAGVRYTDSSSPYWKSGSFASGLMCVRCSSVWFGIIAAICYLINRDVTIIVALPFAISATAFHLQELVRE